VDQAGAAPPELGLADLEDADLFALRLAGQVLGHKAALVGRPGVARWFADFESVVAAELARRGIGVVLVDEPQLALPEDAGEEDQRLVREYLSLLAANQGLSSAQRSFCAALARRVSQ
jgi:hypothetical protein